MDCVCTLRKCTTFFYKGLQNNRRGVSFAKFNQMKDCVVKVLRRIVDQSFDSSVCLEGPPLITSSSVALLPCSSSFVTKANAVGGPSGKYSSQTNRIPLFA
ncbi:hypothetical protein pdam_00003272, partial [Pocillopora damicornis]